MKTALFLAFTLLALAPRGTSLTAYAEQISESTIVYATKTGKSYHREGCTALSRSKLPTTLAEAARAGLGACSLCNPPQLSDSARARFTPALYRLNGAGLGSYREASAARMLRAHVIRHIDGDTVELEFAAPPEGFKRHEKIRMIGVDTPETVHPQKQVEFFGKEASDYTKRALLDKDVYIAFDWDTRDKYGRLLVYIYTAPGICHNAELIRQGYAHAYTRFAFSFMEEFRALEQDARAKKRGLWAR